MTTATARASEAAPTTNATTARSRRLIGAKPSRPAGTATSHERDDSLAACKRCDVAMTDVQHAPRRRGHGPGAVRRSRSTTRASPSARRRARPRATSRRDPHTATGGRPPAGAILSSCSSEQDASRVPELVPIRYGRMLVSPFTFYRGAAYLMAADLAGEPRTGLQVQLCGDAHLSNFGAFAAPDRRLIFSINDFDETLPGPFEWDVKRLVASFAVAGRDRGFDAKRAPRDQPGRGRARTARRCTSTRACRTSTSGTRGSMSTRSPR